jgi:D-xylonolactonase
MDHEIVADYRNHVGEGPTWDPRDKKLYWIDIPNGRIFRYDPASGDHAQIFDGPMMGGFTMQEDGSLLLFMEKGAIAVLRDGKLDYVVDELPGEDGNRFNDVIADPAGRVFCGTMPVDDQRAMVGEHAGSLYRLDTDGTVSPLLREVGLPNGLGFTPDGKGMYFTDSTAYKIYLFDYDQASGELSNRRIFVETDPDRGVPDGMTVDADGYVWSARAMGGAVYRYTPDGKEDMVVPFPTASIPSSVAFGGEDLTEMYVTTIGGHMRDKVGPEAGALFRLRPGVNGRLEHFTRVGL